MSSTIRRLLIFALMPFVVAACGDTPAPESAIAAPEAQRATSEDCAECHGDIHDTYEATVAMARSFYPMTPGVVVEDWAGDNQLDHLASGNRYRMVQEGDRFWQERWQLGLDGSPRRKFRREITHVIGSGNHVRTYVHVAAGGLATQLPVSWYADSKSWQMSPGYDRPDHDDFFRKLDYGCMFCHNGYPTEPVPPRDGYYVEPLPTGIDCTRCHGDGTRHVELARADDAAESDIIAAIVNPARLDQQRRIDVCLQCHLETAVNSGIPHSIRRLDRRVFSFKPGDALEDYLIPFDSRSHVEDREERFEIAHHGYRLTMSECYVQSGGKIECTTCHDPHHKRPLPERKAAFRRACAGCHDAEACTEDHGSPTSTVSPDDCTTCHMPKRRAIDVVHAIMTDHRIAKRPPRQDLTAPLAERQNPFRGELVFHRPKYAPEGSEAKLYLGTAYLQAGRPDLGIPLLEASRAEGVPQHAVPWVMVGVARALKQDLEGAVSALRYAVELAPEGAEVHAQLGAALLRTRRYNEAEQSLRKALSLSPTHADALVALSTIAQQRGDEPTARRLLDQAVDAEPDHVRARRTLAALLARNRDLEGALAHLDHALSVAPRDADIETDLAHLLFGLRRTQEALLHTREVLHRVRDHDRTTRLAVKITALASTASLRDGEEALRLARSLIARHPVPEAGDLELLAAAYAEAGDFSAALENATHALALARRSGKDSLAQRISQRVAAYRQGRPLYDR